MKDFAYHTSLSALKSERVFLVAAIATFLGCFAMDASAANARSYQGTVTNNQTYDGGNYYGQSSAERSSVHLRPLAIDPDHNPRKEVDIVNSTSVYQPAPVYAPAPAIVNQSYVAPAYVAPAAGGTVVGTTRIYNNEPAYLAPSGTVTTTTTRTPAWTDPADVNARSDAGVIITYPVLPAPAVGATVVTSGNAVIGGY